MKNLKRIILIILGILGVFVVFVVSTAFYNVSKPAVFVNEKVVFKNKLVIPPLLEPKIENGEKVFDIKIQEGETAIFSGKPTKTFGFNGSILGPTIRANTGDKVRMNVINSLDEATTVHWHGMHLPASMDGGPHQIIAKDETWKPYWTITNQAATLWYHPHMMGVTGRQVYNGLAGFFIIDDENVESLNLPKDYGVDDIPLVVQDRKFNTDNQLVYDHSHMIHEITAGMLGNIILVNGTYAPYLEVPAKLVRLRVLNGSNARRYNFGFSNNYKFYQIASDGGLLPAPVEKTRMQLSPGERAEILVDLTNLKEPLTLMSYPVVGDPNKVRDFALGAIVGATDNNQQFKILELRPASPASKRDEPQSGEFAKQEIPQVLNKINRLDEASVSKTRVITLDTAAINGKKMDSSRIDDIVTKGDVEIWNVRNESPIHHPFHIHGVQFLVLERNGQKPPPGEEGWKDTVSLNPEELVRLIMQFNDYSDPNLPYMYHCHNLEHEDMGMMAQFVVVDKGTKIDDIKIKSEIQNNFKGEMDMMQH
jgi:bilirubin oxidase